MRYLPFILLFALIVYALVDCVRYDDATMPAGMPKALWIVLIVVFPGAGAIAWIVVSRVHAHASAGGSSRSSYRQPPVQPRRRPVTRQVAPDDDPDFLASLDRPRAEEPPSGEREAQPPVEQDDDDESSSGRPGAPPAA